jgi:hypothetical protein
MSGSLGFAATALTDAEKTDIRRFAGYEAYGADASGFASWRFYTHYGTLEYRMNNLSSAEYQTLRQFLGQLYALEGALVAAGSGGDTDSLDTDKAAVWSRNKREIADRTMLLDSRRRALCGFLGLPPGSALGDRSLRRVI